ILRSDTHRVLALLRHRGVVDHQHRIAAADQMVRLNQQFRLQWRRIPDTSSNKMMQLIIVARRKSLCHWLNALAFTRANQPLPRRGDTSAAAPCDPSDPETASANVQARLANPTVSSSWSALQKPTTYESSKN